jgi:long-chain fatty acid transport protein
MPRSRSIVATSVLLGMSLAARHASAIDGQSVGMGNTGTAYVADGAAIYFNPALLHQTGTFAATAAFAPVVAQLETPIAGPNTETSSSAPVVPLFLLGANYRLSEVLVVGLAVYPTAGFGATYSKIISGQDVTLSVFALEVAPSASFSITKNLSIGASYRLTYTSLSTGTPILSAYENQSLSGVNALGAQVGVFYQPVKPLRLGLAYRSEVKTGLSGTTTYGGLSMPTTSSFAWPHSFRAGAALSLLGDSLLVAADFSYALYSYATQALYITQETPTGPTTAVAPLDWIDAYAIGLGVEYALTPAVPVRLGYAFGRSKTADQAASYFVSPPGFAQTFHAGIGLRLPRWSFDLGAYIEDRSQDVPIDTIANSGRYAIRGVAASLSATFHIEREERP